MPTHDPLTESQLRLLREIEVSPIVMTNQENMNDPRGKDLNYLTALNLVMPIPHHVSQDPTKSTWKWSRTATPLT
jgi:hypothetical protein